MSAKAPIRGGFFSGRSRKFSLSDPPSVFTTRAGRTPSFDDFPFSVGPDRKPERMLACSEGSSLPCTRCFGPWWLFDFGSSDDFPFQSDREKRHFDRKRGRELACSEVNFLPFNRISDSLVAERLRFSNDVPCLWDRKLRQFDRTERRKLVAPRLLRAVRVRSFHDFLPVGSEVDILIGSENRGSPAVREVCVTQNIEVHSFSSLTDGRALTCLVKFYFGNDIYKLLFEKENEDEYNDERIRRFDCLPPTLLGIAFVQIVTAMLRNPPEVLHPCEIFDEDPCFDERSALILFVFLASQLINADKLDIVNSFRFSQQACQSSMPRRSSISRLLHLQSDSSRSRNNLTELFFPHNKEDFGTYSPEAIIHKVKHIQIRWRGLIERRKYLQLKSAASILQAFVRCNLAKRRILGASNLRFSMVHRRSYDVINDGFINNFELRILIGSVIKLQRWWKRLLLRKSRMHAVISIQSFVRGWIARRAAAKRIQNIYMIQRLWRNIYLNRLKKSSALAIQAGIRGWITRETAAKKKCCILKIQRWWRNILYRKTSALIIQAYVRGWIARQKAARNKHDIVLIQSCWKGYLARKYSRPQLLNLRRRMKLSATNVNDEMRLINRLIVALSELLGHKSISNIRHTCATLDIATELSQKCCETLVDAGAIDILLKQIQLLNRGIPDQEVLKHVLSTLRNIARHKHLSQILINTPRSIEILFQELLRNKSEGFLISCQLLKRVCTTEEGLQAVRKLRGHVKRLNNVTVGLERKAKFLERNARLNHQRNLTLRRLREAISLMSLIVKD